MTCPCSIYYLSISEIEGIVAAAVSVAAAVEVFERVDYLLGGGLLGIASVFDEGCLNLKFLYAVIVADSAECESELVADFAVVYQTDENIGFGELLAVDLGYHIVFLRLCAVER